ncbi:hypothetical protein [Rhizobium sp. KDH_Rht_773_N]
MKWFHIVSQIGYTHWLVIFVHRNGAIHSTVMDTHDVIDVVTSEAEIDA